MLYEFNEEEYSKADVQGKPVTPKELWGKNMTKEVWFRMSFNGQMSNIGGEVKRAIRSIRQKMQKEGMEFNPFEDEHVITAFKLIEYSRKDPKNIGLLREIENAKVDLTYFISITTLLDEHEWRQDEERVLDYWNKFESGYMEEMGSTSKKFYFLIRGYREWYLDGADWLGIYDDIHTLKKAYLRAVNQLEKDRQECALGLCDKEEILIYMFNSAIEEVRGMHYQEVYPETLHFFDKDEE